MSDYDKIPECAECSVWIRKTKQGEQFLSLRVVVPSGEIFNAVAFKSKNRKSEKSPHFYFRKKTSEQAEIEKQISSLDW